MEVAERGGRDDDVAAHRESWAECVRIYGEQVVGWCLAWGVERADLTRVARPLLVLLWRHLAEDSLDVRGRWQSNPRRVVAGVLREFTAEIQDASPDGWSPGVYELVSSVRACEDLSARIEAAYETEIFKLACREVELRVEPVTWASFRMLSLENRSGRDVAETLGIGVGLAYVSRWNVQKMIQESFQRLGGGRVWNVTNPMNRARI